MKSLGARARARGWRRKAYPYWLRAGYRALWPVRLWLCGQGWFQRRHAATTDTLRRFLDGIGVPAERRADALRQSLAHTLWRERLLHIHWHTGGKLHQVAGAEHLRAALAQGQGVVLADCHQVFSYLKRSWLAHNGLAPAHVVAFWMRDQPEVVHNPLLRLMKSAQDIQTAAECLRQGRIVRILPDGYKGQRVVTASFCGRWRGFRPAFAGLALRHGAPVVPVSLTLDQAGRLTLTFKPPLTVPQAGHNEQVESLVKQYAAHLAEQWRESPANVPWRHIKRYLELPPA